MEAPMTATTLATAAPTVISRRDESPADLERRYGAANYHPLPVTLQRGGLLLAVLVLPLSIPVLIFGVAASQAAITDPLAFGAPFSILCALSLVSLVVGPFAAAASLRHGLD
jgi:ABC-type transport system involved in cytochrome c biogenesis permease component